MSFISLPSLNALFIDSINNAKLRSLAFGSCAKQKLSQPFWSSILRQDADAWLWIGDAVYTSCSDEACIRNAYKEMLEKPEYSRFKQAIPFLDGTWDDNDYGVNDGGKEYVGKNISQTAFLDFLGISSDSPRRHREGVYSSHIFRLPSSTEKLPLVKFILLDTRTFRDPPFLLKHLTNYQFPFINYLRAIIRFLTGFPGFWLFHKGDILGETQWDWLRDQFMEKEIDGRPVELNILISSIQTFSTIPLFESWGMYPVSKKRLIDLIQETTPRGLTILSGDVHFGQLLGKSNCVVELTSSGLTHSILQNGLFGVLIYEILVPLFKYNFYENNTSFISRTTDLKGRQIYIGKNYGTLEFREADDKNGIKVLGTIRDLQGRPKLETQQIFNYESDNNDYLCLNEFPIFPKRQWIKGCTINILLITTVLGLCYFIVLTYIRALYKVKHIMFPSKSQTPIEGPKEQLEKTKSSTLQLNVENAQQIQEEETDIHVRRRIGLKTDKSTILPSA